MSEETKSKKYGRITFKSVSLGRALHILRKHYEAEKQPEALVIPYVLTCAAYLESKLNESLFLFAMKRYGNEVADALMSLSLPKKLNVLVPVLTDGKYRINTKHIVYQRLASLIRVRNSLAHAKSEIEEVDEDPEGLFGIPFFLTDPTEMLRRPKIDLPDLTLGAAKTFSPLEYHDALQKLERWFHLRYPDRLGKVAIVLDRSKEPQWKEATSKMVKFLE